MKRFYEPIQDQLIRLDRPWVCSYSGGKDSTSLVTWMEWLRRTGWITAPAPKLVMSDTGVEYPFLRDTSEAMMSLLAKSGWHCEVVRPKTREKLYCQIFGRGNQPIHPGMKRLRWCTRSTKIDPMKRRKAATALQLSGVRWGESKVRNEKLLAGGCRAGGECGLPAPEENVVYSPIIEWRDCQVFDWLQGHVDVKGMNDLFAVSRRLLDVYHATKTAEGFGFEPEQMKMLRFGCIGCPAVTRENVFDPFLEENPTWDHLRRLYSMWERMRMTKNRCLRLKNGKVQRGPVRMAVRKKEFETLLDIQEKSGVTLVTEADIRFIKKCWRDQVYPRGWSAADELNKF